MTVVYGLQWKRLISPSRAHGCALTLVITLSNKQSWWDCLLGAVDVWSNLVVSALLLSSSLVLHCEVMARSSTFYRDAFCLSWASCAEIVGACSYLWLISHCRLTTTPLPKNGTFPLNCLEIGRGGFFIFFPPNLLLFLLVYGSSFFCAGCSYLKISEDW